MWKVCSLYFFSRNNVFEKSPKQKFNALIASRKLKWPKLHSEWTYPVSRLYPYVYEELVHQIVKAYQVTYNYSCKIPQVTRRELLTR